MLESILAYIDAHAWAQLALVLLLFAPPVLMAAARRASGLTSLDIVIGWFALLLMSLLLLAAL